jgi:predicted dehydrogenase
MAQEPIRFAYVGCGFVAQSIHIPNFRSLPQCDFRAIAEVRTEIGKKVQARYGIPKLYTSHEEIAADPEIQAVGVSAAFALQGQIAEDLIRAGKHVFMEKPMAVSVARARQMVAAVEGGKARLMVGYMKRYDPGNIALKKHLAAWRESGDRGKILYARNHGFGGNWTYAADPNVAFDHSQEAYPPIPDQAPDWLPAQYKNSYLNYLQQWTHNINLLRFFLDGEKPLPVKVKSVQLDGDGMTGIVVMEINGTRAVVESAYTQFHGWEEHTQIYFEGGWLRTAAPPLMAKETSATVEIYQAGKDGTPPKHITEFAPPAWSYREEAKHFLTSIASGTQFHSSAQDTLRDVELYEEIYKQFIAQQKA